MSPLGPGLADRARETAVRLPRLLTAGVLVVLTVLAGSWLDRVNGPGNGDDRPFVVTGRTAETVDARKLDVTVLGMRGGAVITSYHKPVDTAGVWLLVRIRVTPRSESGGLGWARLTDGRGRRFNLTGRVDQPMTVTTSQPGLPIEGELVFEVPRDVMGPISVQLAFPPIDQRMDAVAEVELPELTAATVAGWVATTAPLTLAGTPS